MNKKNKKHKGFQSQKLNKPFIKKTPYNTKSIDLTVLNEKLLNYQAHILKSNLLNQQNVENNKIFLDLNNLIPKNCMLIRTENVLFVPKPFLIFLSELCKVAKTLPHWVFRDEMCLISNGLCLEIRQKYLLQDYFNNLLEMRGFLRFVTYTVEENLLFQLLELIPLLTMEEIYYFREIFSHKQWISLIFCEKISTAQKLLFFYYIEDAIPFNINPYINEMSNIKTTTSVLNDNKESYELNYLWQSLKAGLPDISLFYDAGFSEESLNKTTPNETAKEKAYTQLGQVYQLLKINISHYVIFLSAQDVQITNYPV